MSVFASVLIALYLIIWGGMAGGIYVAVGVTIACLDWWLCWRPMLDQCSSNIKRYFAQINEITFRDYPGSAERGGEYFLDWWTSKLQGKQLILVSFWLWPGYWTTVPRIVVGLFPGASARRFRKRMYSQLCDACIAADEGFVMYVSHQFSEQLRRDKRQPRT